MTTAYRENNGLQFFGSSLTFAEGPEYKPKENSEPNLLKPITSGEETEVSPPLTL